MTEPAERYQPCTRCGMATEYSTLSALGARCRPCYDAFCREPGRPGLDHVPQRQWAAWQVRRGQAEPEPRGESAHTSDPNTHAFAGPARPVASPTPPEPGDVPAWVIEDQQEARA